MRHAKLVRSLKTKEVEKWSNQKDEYQSSAIREVQRRNRKRRAKLKS